MRSILAIYTFAVAAALFLLLLSPLLLLVNPLAPVVGLLLFISGALVAAFVYDYMNYAAREWGEFTPQGAALSVLFVLSYAVMYMSLMASAVSGAGGANLVIWASFLASAALVFYIIRNVPLHIVGTDPLRDVAAGVKTLPLALVVGLPVGWLIIALYEAGRMIKAGAKIAGAVVALSIFLMPVFLPLISVSSFTISVFSPFIMQATGVEVLTWPGIIAWEELTTRFVLPAAGALANYMFVVLHAPSRWLMAMFLAPAILAVISMGTRWLTDLYKRHGLVGSIAGHAIYNGMLGWLAGLIYFPILTVVTLVVLVIVYIYVKSS